MGHNKLVILQWFEARLAACLLEVTQATGDFYGNLSVGKHENLLTGGFSVYIEFTPFNNPALHCINIGADIEANGGAEVSVGYCCGSNYRSLSFEFGEDFSDFLNQSNPINKINFIITEGRDLLINIYRDPQGLSEYWDCPEWNADVDE